MSNYIREHTFMSIIRATFDIYGRHFATLFLMATVPFVLLAFSQTILTAEREYTLTLLSNILFMPLYTLIWAALTIAVSNICLGNKPSLIVSYKYILSATVPKLLVTNLLQLLAVLCGLVLLIIPGCICMVWFIFVPSIVIMENMWGIAALKEVVPSVVEG